MVGDAGARRDLRVFGSAAAVTNTILRRAIVLMKRPPLANALRKSGMAAREYAKFMMAVMVALAYGFQKSGMKVEGAKLTDVQQPNVKFVGEHQAELQKLQEECKGLGSTRTRSSVNPPGACPPDRFASHAPQARATRPRTP
jgi:hypothetical protein